MFWRRLGARLPAPAPAPAAPAPGRTGAVCGRQRLLAQSSVQAQPLLQDRGRLLQAVDASMEVSFNTVQKKQT